MAPFVLKFKGNKSFSPFSNLADSDALARTWKVCTKVAAHLEQGQRLENLSWRLWHLQNLMVEADNAKSRREFKKLSKNMGERLDKDKGRSIEELEAPDFKRSENVEKIKRRAEEKERAGHGRTGMKSMTFTFPADPITNRTPGATVVATHPSKKHSHPRHLARDDFDETMEVLNGTPNALVIDTNVSSLDNAPTPTSAFVSESSLPESGKLSRTHYRGHHDSISSISSATSIYPSNYTTSPSPPTSNTSVGGGSINGAPLHQSHPGSIRFPSLFNNGFGPTALLCPAPTVKQNSTYGEAIGFAGLTSASRHANSFSIPRPTFEFHVDELMNGETGSDHDGSTNGWCADDASNLTNSVSSLSLPTPVSASMASFRELQITPNHGASDAMQGIQTTGIGKDTITVNTELDGDELEKKSPPLVPSQSAPASPALYATSANPSVFQNEQENSFPPPLTLPKGATLPGPSPTPSPAPAPAHRIPRRYSTTNAPPPEGKKGRHPSATAPRSIRASYGNSAPGGVKSECANCGANSTPLWRRGLNDELNCNACGLFAKLHKRPRPKSLRNSAGEGGTRNPGWASNRNGDEAGEPVSCYNCATIATPLWRKDEEGRTLCNALKLHGEKRPSSMKSDVIRKRSRHDARRGTSSSATPSASPGASRRTSPTPPISGSANMTPQPGNPDPNAGYAPGQQANPQQQAHSPSDPHANSPYAQTSSSFEYGSSQNQDNSPVDLMSMNHAMVSDSGVEPALGPMTFSPGLTYTETLHYPGPVSLSYYFAQYGDPNASAEQQNQHHQAQIAHVSSQSPNMQTVSSPPTADVNANGVLFGPQNNGNPADVANAWDHPSLQLPFPTTYTFNYPTSLPDHTAQQNPQANQAGSLGFVHPPMLPGPYWYADSTAVSTKPDPEHEMTFGHH
ncbi:hypothetical protein FRB99_000118 [Tulasnella sp. 403]|nr:hypothetical protein FRB99_000118 [Tulasnella sp. 403]